MDRYGTMKRPAVFLQKGLCILLLMTLFTALANDSSNAKTDNTTKAVEKPAGKMERIRLITRDDDTGESIPCRIVIADSHDTYWGLDGQMPEKRIFFYTPGDTLLALSPGNFRATVFRGFEYTPVKDKLFTVPDSPESSPFTVEIPLRRWIHMKELGWFSCDSEVHVGGSPELSDLQRIYTIQRGEDVNLLNLAAYGQGSMTQKLFRFLQKDPLSFSIPFYPMVVGEEWRSGAWQNHMIIMGLSRPLSVHGSGWFNYPTSPYRFTYPPALDFCDEAHALGAIVFPCHSFQWNKPWAAPMGDNTELYAAFELPVDVALGKVDGMAVYTFSQQDTWNRLVWYKLLNCGFRVAPFAGTDISDFTGNHVQMGIQGAYIGRVRSYTYIPNQTDDLNFQEWMSETVKGRSFVSSGPMVFSTVNGEMPGSELSLKTIEGETTVSVNVDAQWVNGINGVSIIVNGDLVYTEDGGGNKRVTLNKDVRLTRSSWIAIKVDGKPFIDMFNGCAHSAPVYVTIDKSPIHSRTDALYFVDWIDRHIALLDSTNHFDTRAHEKRTFDLYRKGQDEYRKIARKTEIQGIRMVPIPAGEFKMGSNFEDDPVNPMKGKGKFKGEKPVHDVEVSAFEMSATEVTVGQFREFVDETGYLTEAERNGDALVFVDGKWQKRADANWKNPYYEQGDDHPVVCVSWNDAVKFCDWLSEETGHEYYLPTEAEWEYACRAGSITTYNLGDDENDLVRAGWYYANAGDRLLAGEKWDRDAIQSAGCRPHTVGMKTPNSWGLFDMHGNVWEWCNDWHGREMNSYNSNPTHKKSDYGRIFRGGAWFNNFYHCRSATRIAYPANHSDSSMGFRIVRRP
ncbi:SUMF1/EgtB/PvdO family nonheme iron enzyme [Candidatus Omnitrophota bacterium]